MSPSFCVLPWMHLATHPNGGVSLCCRSNHTNAISWAHKKDSKSLMLLDNENLIDVFNSHTFTHVREQMLKGNRPLECEGCWQDEDSGIESKRQYENKRWQHIIPILDLQSQPKKVQYKYIELRLGNTCNTACITCNSYSSSKWYKDEKYLSESLDWFILRPQENWKWFEDPEFYSNLAIMSKEAEEIYINGGEPTLIKAHYRYLEKLIKKKISQKVHLVYSLNLTQMPDEFLNLISNFKKVTINCSIDDLDERNYYIRWPTTWTHVCDSIDKLQNLYNINWNITQTVSALNVEHLDKFRSWTLNSYGKEPVHNYVMYPSYFSLSTLPKSYKNYIVDKLAGKLTKQQYTDLLGKLEVNFNLDDYIKAKEVLLLLDKSRGLSYKDYLPHLDNIYNNETDSN